MPPFGTECLTAVSNKLHSRNLAEISWKGEFSGCTSELATPAQTAENLTQRHWAWVNLHKNRYQGRIKRTITVTTIVFNLKSVSSVGTHCTSTGVKRFLFVLRVASSTKMFHRNRQATGQNIIMWGLLITGMGPIGPTVPSIG